ncbi:hypothetical protein [Mucilaginibacter myungsuensis]|uniref:Uncharacterized protein n=1 Tax=Mucilaginibacter myungsuensis TaxID=649104 RepID=A0A929KX11_9SPHI|nr:hypothetical protein [Mucilaginibacter myungsuensis]MBE9662020.1 hypothetical protein [Mucilaginibacter myungsuensis]
MNLQVVETDIEYVRILNDNFSSELFVFTCFRFENVEEFLTICSEGEISRSEIGRSFLLSKPVLDQFQQEVYSGPSQYVSADALVLEVDLQRLDAGKNIESILADVLFYGGLGNTDFQGSYDSALQLATSFCEKIFEGVYTQRNAYCLRTLSPWNTWFMAGPYTFSETVLLTVEKTKSIWLLAYSTSD